MNNQLKDRVKEAMDRGKVSMLELERQTGIPANRMYKWYQQGTNPKKDDADKLEKWLNDLEKHTNEAELQEPQANYESRRSLENTLEKLAEDKLRSTAIIERLVSMLENAFGVSGLQLPTPGTPGTRTLTEKDKVNSQKR
jgi:transcriptional regulator with XRE-family HTH domain